MEKQELARIIALADLKERMKGKEAMALEQGKKMAEIAAEVKFSLLLWNEMHPSIPSMYRVLISCTGRTQSFGSSKKEKGR